MSHSRILAIAFVLSGTPAILAAQAQRPFNFELGAGATFLSGDDRSFFHDGYNVQAGISVPSSIPQLSILATAFYHAFGGKNKSDQVVPGAPDTLRLGDFSVLAGTLGAQWRMTAPSATPRIAPYVTFGAGVYRVESKAVLYGQPVSGSDTKMGATFGFGLDVPVASKAAFVEIRVHNIFTDAGSSRLYPVTAGIRF